MSADPNPRPLSSLPLARRGTPLLHTPLRWLSGGLAALALIAGAVLLLFDGVPHSLPGLAHAPVSAAPLLLIGLAYLALQLLLRPRALELLTRLMLAAAFILWGIDQLLPAGAPATVLGDVVIVLYVLDLGLMIADQVRRAATASTHAHSTPRPPS